MKATFRYSGPDRGHDWSQPSDGVVHLQRESVGWRVVDFIDNRRSQLAGVFLEPAGGLEFADIKVAPLFAELSHMGLLVVFQVLNRTSEPLELVFTRLRHKACRVRATVPERPHIAPPGVITTSLAIFPIALPVETPKLRLEFGMFGSRTSTGYNITLDVGLNSTKLDSPKTKKRRGRRTNLPVFARLGLGMAALAVLLGGLTMLPKTVAASVRPEGSPPAAADVAYEFVGATFDGDREAAIDLLSEQAGTPARQVDGLIKALSQEDQDELGAPLASETGFPAVARIGYPFVGGMCSLGRPEVRSWIVLDLLREPAGWRITEAWHSVEDEPCGN